MSKYEDGGPPFAPKAADTFAASIQIWGRFVEETACIIARKRKSAVVESSDLQTAWEMCRNSGFDPVEA